MKKYARMIISAVLSVLTLAGAAALCGCFHPDITPQDGYIGARNGFIDALTRGPWKLIPRPDFKESDADGENAAVTVDFGEDGEDLTAYLYRAKKGDDFIGSVKAVYGDRSVSARVERLDGVTYESFSDLVPGYLIMDEGTVVLSLDDVCFVNSEGLLRLTDRFATPERITSSDEEIELDGATVRAERFTLTLDREALEEIRGAILSEEALDSILDAGENLDEVFDPDAVDLDELSGDVTVLISFWKAAGATRKAEIAVTGEDFKFTFTAMIKSDEYSVNVDFSLSFEDKGKLGFAVPGSFSYSEKDGKFDWGLFIDAANAVIPKTDDISVYGSGVRTLDISSISLSAAGTYGDGFIEGTLTAAIEAAGGQLTQSVSADFRASKEPSENRVTFEIVPGRGLPDGVTVTGVAEPGYYTPGEYDPGQGIRFSEREGADAGRFEEYLDKVKETFGAMAQELSDTLGSGPDAEYEDDPRVYFVGDEGYLCLYEDGEGYYGMQVDMTVDGSEVSVVTPEGILRVDVEKRPDTTMAGWVLYVCNYVDTEDYVFVTVYKRYEKEGEFSTYYFTVYKDDPSSSHADCEIAFNYEKTGDEYVCHLPEGDVTFTYRQGDATVLIDGEECEVHEIG